MSEEKKTSEGTFMDKVKGFFKKVGTVCKETALKVWAFCKKAALAVADFAKKAWAWFLAIDWNAPVKPVVAWSTFGGVLGLSVVLMLIFWVIV
jgi:hypothetical protein